MVCSWYVLLPRPIQLSIKNHISKGLSVSEAIKYEASLTRMKHLQEKMSKQKVTKPNQYNAGNLKNMSEQIKIATWNLCLGLFHKKDYVKTLLNKFKLTFSTFKKHPSRIALQGVRLTVLNILKYFEYFKYFIF